jgi:hypothetical protein
VSCASIFLAKWKVLFSFKLPENISCLSAEKRCGVGCEGGGGEESPR